MDLSCRKNSFSILFYFWFFVLFFFLIFILLDISLQDLCFILIFSWSLLLAWHDRSMRRMILCYFQMLVKEMSRMKIVIAHWFYSSSREWPLLGLGSHFILFLFRRDVWVYTERGQPSSEFQSFLFIFFSWADILFYDLFFVLSNGLVIVWG